MLTIGYKASAEQFGPRELVDFAVLAEQVGLDSVWISDHFQPWRHVGGHAPYALSWLAAAGERTSRVVLGTSVLTPTFRYNPAVLAQAFGTLGALYPGRIVLGVGTGEALNEIVVGQREWPEFKERFARLREAVSLMRELWSDERVSFEGEYYRTVDATVYDRPEQPIPVFIAGAGPLVARYAGRAGDGFICTSGKGRELYVDSLLPAVTEGIDKAGRQSGDVERMIEVKLSWDPDLEQAKRNCRFWAPLSLTPEQKHGLSDPVAMAEAADALTDDEVARRWIVTNDPDEAASRVREYVEMGFDHVVFHGPGSDQERYLRTFASDILPRLRALGLALWPESGPDAPPRAGVEGHTQRSKGHLDGELDPVDAAGVVHVEQRCDRRADERGDDADQDRREHADVLSSSDDESSQNSDDRADDDRADDCRHVMPPS